MANAEADRASIHLVDDIVPHDDELSRKATIYSFKSSSKRTLFAKRSRVTTVSIVIRLVL